MLIEDLIKKLQELNKNHKNLKVVYKFELDNAMSQEISDVIFQNDKIVIVVEE